MSWKSDLGLVGGGIALGGLLGGTLVGVRRLNKHVADNTPDAPADYVTLMGPEYNQYFHDLKRFVSTVEEKSFLKTLRHRVSRLIKLTYSAPSSVKDTPYWTRMGAICLREAEAQRLLNNLQYLVKERNDNKPMIGFDDAVLAIRQICDDIRHNNTLQGRDID